MLNKFIIAAPFGNYLNWPGFTSTLGSFTVENRGGVLYRIWRVAKTLRYHPGMQAWTNKLGLPNPGIDWLINKVKDGKIDLTDKIVNISARNDADWYKLLDKLARFNVLAIELNISCPNCPDEPDYTNYCDIFRAAVVRFEKTIVKVAPVGYQLRIDQAVQEGIWGVHCCNTLLTPQGGMSGKPLQLLALEAVRYCKNIKRIGGGGITHKEDVVRFKEAGADYYSMGTATLNPLNWSRLKGFMNI